MPLQQDLDRLRDQACACLAMMLPAESGNPSQLVDECLTSARRTLRDEFILQLSPQAWAQLALIYTTHFLDSGVDVPMGDIVAAVVRDALHTRRLDMVTSRLAQERQAVHFSAPEPVRASAPVLRLVKS